MTKRVGLLQISATLENRVGGPVHVVMQSSPLLDNRFNHKLVVVGQANNCQGNVKELRALFNNRFGVPLISGILELRREIHESEKILIHGFYLLSTLITLAFSNSQDIFLMPHGSLELYGRRKSQIRKAVFRWIVGLTSKVDKIHFIVASKSEAEQISYQFPNNYVTVVGIGINTYQKSLREPNKRISTVLRLITISRIDEVKRLDLLISAVSKIQESGLCVNLSIIGSGNPKLLKKLEILKASLNLENSVNFLGYMGSDKKYDILDKSDIFILASDNENFGIAAAEAASRGIPVVVSRNVGFSSFVSERGIGIVTGSNSASDLARAIIRIANSYSEYEERTMASSSFLSWEEVIDIWEETLKNYRKSLSC